MSTIQKPRSLSASGLSPSDARAVLATARRLQRAAQSGSMDQLLRGKKLGLLCAEPGGAEAALFRHAAETLGAHVAEIPPSLSESSSANDVTHTARLLGRLYDAVECQGMTPTLVHRIACEAGVPVYDGIASLVHPTALLTEQLDGDAPPADKRRLVVQAVLLSTIA